MEFWQQIILSLVSFFVGGGLSSFFTIRYKKRREKIDATEKIVEFYEKQFIIVNDKYDALQKENEILRKKQAEMQKEISELREKLWELQKNTRQ